MRRKNKKKSTNKSSKLEKKFRKNRKIKTQKGKGWFSKNANLIKRIFGG